MRIDLPAFLLVHGAVERLDLRRDGYREIPLDHGHTRLLVRGSVDQTTSDDGASETVLVGCVIGRFDRMTVVPGAGARDEPTRDIGTAALGLTGHFAGVVIESDGAWAFTDHMGSLPVYETMFAAGPAVRCLGTDLVDVAHVAGRLRPDEASMREFSSRGGVTSPHTVYDQVSRVWPGTVVSLTMSHAAAPPARGECAYWVPAGGGACSTSDLADIAASARAVMDRNLEELLARRRRVAVLMSGGEDSRALAARIRSIRSSGQDLQGIIFLDAPNREYLLARAAARLIGIPLEIRLRAKDQSYLELASQLRRVGPGYGISVAHSATLCQPDEADLFIDGFAADTLLKAACLPSRQRGVGRFALTLAKPIAGGGAPWIRGVDEEVERRQQAKYERLAAWRPLADLEAWMDVWPISDKQTYALFAGNRSALPSASPYLFGDFVSTIVRVPEADKLNRTFFRAVFGRSMGASGWVPRSGGQIPRLGGRSNLVAANTIGTAFRVDESRVQRRDSEASGGPWQTWRVRRSAAVEALASVPPGSVASAEVLAGISGDASCPTVRLERLVQVAAAMDADLIGSSGQLSDKAGVQAR